MGEATVGANKGQRPGPDFNPRFPWGKRPDGLCKGADAGAISIHASRGGSDRADSAGESAFGISIHASRGGSDAGDTGRCGARKDFNPRFPWGKRRAGVSC